MASTAGAASTFNPIGAAVQGAGLGLNIIMGLLAKHDQRMKIAKEENAAVNQAVTALDADLHTVIDALNKGDITEAVALITLQDISIWYWQFIGPFEQGPQKGPHSSHAYPLKGGTGNGACYAANLPNRASDGIPVGNHCAGTTCTAGCCIGANVVDATIANAVYAIQKHGGAFTVCGSAANKYGGVARAAYTLTYKKPAKLQSEAEVTINKKTGVVTVGALPSQNDAVITGGVVSRAGATDAGGDQIQHDASGTDVNVTGAGLANLFAAIPGGAMTVAAFALVVVALLVTEKK